MTWGRRSEIASAAVALVSITAVLAVVIAAVMTAPALAPERDPRAAATKGPAPTWGAGGDIDR